MLVLPHPVRGEAADIALLVEDSPALAELLSLVPGGQTLAVEVVLLGRETLKCLRPAFPVAILPLIPAAIRFEILPLSVPNPPD